jgi:hypothetical protein
MNVFFDLEFTDLSDGASIISAAFVTEGQQTLYLELDQSSWERQPVSDFVRDQVIPLLDGGAPLAHAAFSEKAVAWLGALGGEIRLISDSEWDVRLFRQHLNEDGYDWLSNWTWAQAPQNLPAREQTRIFDAEYLAFFLRTKRQRHHALSDAEALRYAWLRASNACDETSHSV